MVKVIGEGTVAALGDGFVSSVRVVVDIIGEVMWLTMNGLRMSLPQNECKIHLHADPNASII